MSEHKSLLGMGDELPFNFIRNRSSNRGSYEGSGSIALSGSLTITGNLTVQQSDWVYLRGPITSSRILVNGSLTGSNVWIRSGSGQFEESDIKTHNSNMGNLIVDTSITASNLWVKDTIRFGENRDMIMISKKDWDVVVKRITDLENIVYKKPI